MKRQKYKELSDPLMTSRVAESQALVAHAYNLSYIGSRNQEDHCKPALGT
jgi:hypothetical protein